VDTYVRYQDVKPKYVYEDTCERNKNMYLDRKGQGFSFVWALVAVGIGLFFATLMWIVLDQVRSSAEPTALAIGADAAHMNTLNSIWSIAPFLMLFSFGLFIYIVANATRGGDFVG